jgi:hydroxyethylthiazole kinase
MGRVSKGTFNAVILSEAKDLQGGTHKQILRCAQDDIHGGMIIIKEFLVTTITTTEINTILARIKQEKPIILNITNNVTMDFVANGLLSVGASPLMSLAEQEMEELVTIAHAVVINLGTLDSRFVHLCHHACLLANQWGKPIILDPVGAGASRYRTDTALELLLEFSISIIRGNASEIMALSESPMPMTVIDNATELDAAIYNAKSLANHYNAAIMISGKRDVMVDSGKVAYCDRGSPMMSMVTGTGCLLSALLGAFRAVEEDRFLATQAAAVFFATCGEQAARKASGPGSFKVSLMDVLYSLYHLPRVEEAL